MSFYFIRTQDAVLDIYDDVLSRDLIATLLNTEHFNYQSNLLFGFTLITPRMTPTRDTHGCARISGIPNPIFCDAILTRSYAYQYQRQFLKQHQYGLKLQQLITFVDLL